MVPIVQKFNLLNFKSNLQDSISAESVSCQPTQKIFDFAVASSLNWTNICHQETKKTTSALYQIKRNLSKILQAQNAPERICCSVASTLVYGSKDLALKNTADKT